MSQIQKMMRTTVCQVCRTGKYSMVHNSIYSKRCSVAQVNRRTHRRNVSFSMTRNNSLQTRTRRKQQGSRPTYNCVCNVGFYFISIDWTGPCMCAGTNPTLTSVYGLDKGIPGAPPLSQMPHYSLLKTTTTTTSNDCTLLS